jgi:pectin methylesterase-like acyl-CoA thioesterase
VIIADVMRGFTGCRTQCATGNSADNGTNWAAYCGADDTTGNGTATRPGHTAHRAVTFVCARYFRSWNMHIAAVCYFACTAVYTSLVHCFAS